MYIGLSQERHVGVVQGVPQLLEALLRVCETTGSMLSLVRPTPMHTQAPTPTPITPVLKHGGKFRHR